MNLDIGGYLTSAEFLSAIAAFIAQLFTALFGGIIASLFGVA